MDYKKELENISNTILTTKNLDVKDFIFNYKNMIGQISYFHNVIGKNAKNPQELSSIKYDIPKEKMPNIGQVAYFQIEHSYPKEIFNGHWCLVFQNFGNTMLIIPLTSIKSDSIPVNDNNEMEICVRDFEEEGNSKLKIHQMFCADLMRLDKRKQIYNLETSFDDIKNKVRNVMGI